MTENSLSPTREENVHETSKCYRLPSADSLNVPIRQALAQNQNHYV